MDGSPGGEGQPGAEGQDFLVDENSQSSLGSFSTKKKKQWGDVGGNEMAGIHNPLANVTAETLFEYKWPLEGRSSEHFFLQEQVRCTIRSNIFCLFQCFVVVDIFLFE